MIEKESNELIWVEGFLDGLWLQKSFPILLMCENINIFS